MELSDFIKLNIDKDSEREKVYEAYIQYLTTLSDKDYPISEINKLGSYSEKFFSALRQKRFLKDSDKDAFFNVVDGLNEAIIRRRTLYLRPLLLYRWLFKKAIKARAEFSIDESYQNLLNESIRLIGVAKELDHLSNHLDIGEFYNPQNSNKQRIKQLLREAIEELDKDITLKDKSKKRIKNFIERAIDQLDSDYTNWTEFLGKLKETIIVLGALGSVAGGVSVLSARDKVNEATQVVYQTSITVNYKSINESFNINDAPKLERFQNLLMLDENNVIEVKTDENK